MSNISKKIIFITSITVVLVTAIFIFIEVNTSKDMEFKSGKYHCKVSIFNENNARIFKWETGISKDQIKSNIIENESNHKTLEDFRKTIVDIERNKINIFFYGIYLIFMLIVLLTALRDKQIYKALNNKKSLELLFMVLIIFLTYRIIHLSVAINRLFKDAVYYFNYI